MNKQWKSHYTGQSKVLKMMRMKSVVEWFMSAEASPMAGKV